MSAYAPTWLPQKQIKGTAVDERAEFSLVLNIYEYWEFIKEDVGAWLTNYSDSK